MRVAFVAAEAVPWVKVGGLADVAGSLPRALAGLGVEMRLYLPWVEGIEAAETSEVSFVWDGTAQTARIGELEAGGVRVHPVGLPDFGRGPVYEEDGDRARFARFSLAVDAALARDPVDIVHVHDWHTALLPALLHARGSPVRSVLTIHNLAYQGLWESKVFFDHTALPRSLFRTEGLEFHGKVNLLKGGLVFADRITTVSRRYAEEILTEELGCGLDGVLRYYGAKLRGIRNGIDTDYWNPRTDPHLRDRYRSARGPGKAACRRALQAELGLEPPVLGMIARLTEQKGVDLVLRALPRILELGWSLVVLGSGEGSLETSLRSAAGRHPGRVVYREGYDEPLAHRIFAGADAFLVPSRWEPCGLTQMVAMRYGTPPVARAVGGLADTIDDGVDGLLFESAHHEGLLSALCRLTHLRGRAALGAAGMKRDFGWAEPAREYLELYGEIEKDRSA